MDYKLTNSQQNFYGTNSEYYSAFWNHGGIDLFNKVYTYDELNTAFNKLIKNFESLRMCFKNDETDYSLFLKKYEFKNYPFVCFETEEELMEVSSNLTNSSLNLYDELITCIIFNTPTKSGYIFCVHHIIIDGFSTQVMGKYLNNCLKNNLYTSENIQSYEEYISNEETYINSKRYQKDRIFWSQQFYDNPQCSIFEEKKNSFDYASYEVNYGICPELFNKIRAFCENNYISVQNYFNTVYSTYVFRTLGTDFFTIGVPVLNRTTEAELNTIGLYMHIVPLLVKISDDSFLQNAVNTEDAQMTLFRHQKFTQYDIKELLKEEGKPQNILFDIATDYQEFEENEDYEFKFIYSNSLSVPIEIHLQSFGEKKHNLKIRYRTPMFSEREIQTMINSIIAIAEDALENPDKNITDLEMVSTDEKQKILYDFNDTAADYPRDKCVHELFEEIAEKNPDKIAVVACDKTLTCKELNEEANRIAHTLIEKGVGRGDIVAFKLARRSYLIATMIGILKAGAAYMPIDPDYPHERIEYMLEDSSAKYCVTEENVYELLGNLNSYNPDVIVKSTDICYCIYTSGSTGNPKGAMICHNNLMNFCNDTPVNNLQHYIARQCSAVLACGSIVFDISNFEIFLSLLLNKSVILANEKEVSNANSLAALIRNNRIDCVHCTPTKLRTYFYSKEFSSSFRNVKCVMVGGERFTKDIYETIRSFSDAKIFNGYGPTETTMGVGFGEVNDDIITIGKPIANTQIYIVDKYMNPVPIGVTGEICIAGDCVGAGYLNRPELTAEKFIDNPFGAGKLYKTGDLAYWREDGNIVFVGRNDFQVKVRGLRIELGEIENAISAVEGINMSVVVVRKDNQDRQLLCAFYTGEEKSAKEIREEIGKSLPKYMIPHIFTHLPEMPMTSSGKTNRNALPEVDLDSIETSTEYVAPEAKEEIALADVVCSVLRVNSINMLDNFFNIGGDSIKAIYIVSELEEAGYELHVADIMQSDTLSDIAKAMKLTSDRAIYDQNEVNGFIPFSPIMRIFLKENNTIPKDFVHTCIISADCDEDTARKALDVLISHHDILRGTFCDNGIEIHPSNERDVYSFKAMTIDGTDKAKEYLKDISIDDNKLVNVVFCNTEKESLISITVHHFLIDLVSWEVLINDFRTVVKQMKNNADISLPAKTASFMLWNEELQKYSETISEGSKEYWEDINCRLDKTKPLCSHEENKNEAETYNFTFDKNFSNKLIYEANKTYGTRINEVLLTALGFAAGRIAGGSVGIMVESHGRTELHKRISVERTVGWFTSVYPVVINSNNNVTDELINTKETLRRIPKNGIDYLLLSDGFHENTEIIFNFYQSSVANGDRKNKLISFNSGASVFQGKINVNCIITDNILTVNISVAKCKHKQQISEELGMEFVRQIEKIVDICTTTDKVVKTRSDFSDDELSEIELNELKDLFEWTDDDEKQY